MVDDFKGDISWEVPFPKIACPFSEPVRNFTAKKNYIGTAVSEILSYRHTNKNYLLFYLFRILFNLFISKYCVFINL